MSNAQSKLELLQAQKDRIEDRLYDDSRRLSVFEEEKLENDAQILEEEIRAVEHAAAFQGLFQPLKEGEDAAYREERYAEAVL